MAIIVKVGSVVQVPLIVKIVMLNRDGTTHPTSGGGTGSSRPAHGQKQPRSV